MAADKRRFCRLLSPAGSRSLYSSPGFELILIGVLVPSLLLNFFMLGLGVFTLLRAIRAGRVFEANLGMLVVAILAIARFFDNDLEFVVRGIAFIAIGLGFLGTNLVVFKRRARA